MKQPLLIVVILVAVVLGAAVVYTSFWPTKFCKTDLICVSTPRPNQTISSPLVLEGEARGVWFFEASFPIKLIDLEGNEIAVSHAEAQGEWMTTNFVAYQSTLNFTVPPGVDRGVLVLQKDNPSGLPEHDAQFIIPVTF